jgi:hypothetical protein
VILLLKYVLRPYTFKAMVSAAAADYQYQENQAAAVVSAESKAAYSRIFMTAAAAAKQKDDDYAAAVISFAESKAPKSHIVTSFNIYISYY